MEKLAVLVSGSGTNLQAILDAAVANSEVAVVVVPWNGDRVAHTKAVCDAAEEHGATAMVLAGYMRILDAEAIRRFPYRILNIHPALLPSFPGAHGVAEALDHGVKVSGVTVHFVDKQVDHGPIIAQRAVPVLSGDTEDELFARIHEQEHVLFPEVVKAFAHGRLHIDGRRVEWREP